MQKKSDLEFYVITGMIFLVPFLILLAAGCPKFALAYPVFIMGATALSKILDAYDQTPL
jgi:hypothetical protein